MKKFLSLVVALFALFFVACGGGNSGNSGANKPAAQTPAKAQKTDIYVFAAASLTETLTKLKGAYEATHNVNIIYTFDSSGTLLRQILAGAECDLFISAAQKQMNALDITKDEKANKDRNNYLLAGSRVDLLENKVALAVAKGNPAGITSFADITGGKLKMLAIGNSDVPVGGYTLEIFKYLGTSDKALADAGKLTYGSNVKEVTTQVAQGVVDAGIIYATDAHSAGLQVVDVATKDMCRRVIYPAAVLKASKNAAAAAEFLKFLQGNEAMKVFASVGFAPAK